MVFAVPPSTNIVAALGDRIEPVETQCFGKVVSIRHKPCNADAIPSNSTRQIAFGGRGRGISVQRVSSRVDSILAVVTGIRLGLDPVKHPFQLTEDLRNSARSHG